MRLFLFLWDILFFSENCFFCGTFSFLVRLFVSLWNFFYFSETSDICLGLLISLWDLLFICETFLFCETLFVHEMFGFFVKLFISLWDFFNFSETFPFLCEIFYYSVRPFIFSMKTFLLGVFGRLYGLCLVLRAQHIYSLDTEKVCRGKLCHVSENFLIFLW